MNKRSHDQEGVSLLEALVAMAVMAFGMLALLGLQGSLRGSSDISKQRAEAVRFAQVSIEEKRSFSVIELDALRRDYDDDIKNEALPSSVALTGYNSSAAFNRQVRVSELPAGSTTEAELYYMPSRKQLAVDVTWLDRNNEAQRVQLNTIVSRSAPEIAGSLSVNGSGSAARNPRGRNPVIPPAAVNLDGADSGKSYVRVPTSGTPLAWKFDNKTGYIVATCGLNEVDSVLTLVNCTTLGRPLSLLWGYIRFATSVSGQPTSEQSENPTDLGLGVPDVNVGMVMHQPVNQEPFPVANPVVCYVDTSTSAFGAYYCALDSNVLNSNLDPPSREAFWSGRSTVTLNRCWDSSTRDDGPDEPDLSSPYRCVAADAARFATNQSDAAASKFRICRYTTRRDNSVVGSGTPPFTNVEHPLDYVAQTGSLGNQNFLVIRAGNGSTPYSCPEDDSGTPIIGTTWDHQPARP